MTHGMTLLIKDESEPQVIHLNMIRELPGESDGVAVGTSMLTAVELLAAVVPESRGKITSSGGPVPVAYDVEESGLRELLGGEVPLTPLRDGIVETVEHFRNLARAGRLHDRDLS